jgi:glycosyltransferase involved in cell wall biosynthesis
MIEYSTLPSIVIVGGSDVDARLTIMQFLRGKFNFVAAGSSHALSVHFATVGFPYYFFPMMRGINPPRDAYAFFHLILLFWRLRPDVVHTFDTKPSVWGRLAARVAGVPIVIGTLPGLGILYADSRITTRLMRRIYQPLQKLASHFSDMTIFQNHDDAQQFIDDGVVPQSKSAIVLGSGVRTDVFNPALMCLEDQERLRSELGIGNEDVVVMMISRVIRSKGVLEFMRAAEIVREHHPQVRFVLVGPLDEDSIDRLSPKELAQLTHTVTWLGARQDIPLLLSISSIFV